MVPSSEFMHSKRDIQSGRLYRATCALEALSQSRSTTGSASLVACSALMDRGTTMPCELRGEGVACTATQAAVKERRKEGII